MSDSGASASVSPMAAITAKLDSGEVSGSPINGVNELDSVQGDVPNPAGASQQAEVADAPDPGQEHSPQEAQAASSASDPQNPVPYKRFHGVIQERNSAREQIKMLTEQLAAAKSVTEKPPWIDSVLGKGSQSNTSFGAEESESEFFENLFSGNEQQPQGRSQTPAIPHQMSGMMNKMMQRLEQLETQNKDFLQDRKDREYGRHIGQIKQNNEHIPEDVLIRLAVAGVSPDVLQEVAVGLQGHIHGLMGSSQGAGANAPPSPAAPPAAPRPAGAPSAKSAQNEGRPDAKAMQDDRNRMKWLNSVADKLPGGLFGT